MLHNRRAGFQREASDEASVPGRVACTGGAGWDFTVGRSMAMPGKSEDFDCARLTMSSTVRVTVFRVGCVPFDGVPVYHSSVGVDLRTAQDGGLERDGPAYASFARQAQERYGLRRVLVDGREVRWAFTRPPPALIFHTSVRFQGRGGDGEACRAVMHIARFARLCLVVGQVQG